MDIREEKITGLSFLPESKIFLDIETSGFHPQTSSLFMAGFLISSSAEHLLRQLYVTSPQAAEEKALLQRCFSHFSPFFFEKDSFSEIGEIPHTKADTLQDFCFVVAAFNEAI